MSAYVRVALNEVNDTEIVSNVPLNRLWNLETLADYNKFRCSGLRWNLVTQLTWSMVRKFGELAEIKNSSP